MITEALPYLSVAVVEGPDARAFLQAQLSADIDGLEPGGSTFACHCSPRGQVHALLLVGQTRQGYLLVAAAELLADVLRRLRKYVMRSRLTMEQAEHLVVRGESGESGNGAGPSHSFVPADHSLGYRVGPADGAPGMPADQWKRLELTGGVAWLSPGTTERFIPQMLGFDTLGAVSFRKGCYPGQEIIARSRYLGEVKRKPLCLQVEVALAVVPGTVLQIQRGEAWIEATVVDSVVRDADRQHADTLLFLVAPAAEGVVETIQCDGRHYRCATM